VNSRKEEDGPANILVKGDVLVQRDDAVDEGVS